MSYVPFPSYPQSSEILGFNDEYMLPSYNSFDDRSPLSPYASDTVTLLPPAGFSNYGPSAQDFLTFIEEDYQTPNSNTPEYVNLALKLSKLHHKNCHPCLVLKHTVRLSNFLLDTILTWVDHPTAIPDDREYERLRDSYLRAISYFTNPCLCGAEHIPEIMGGIQIALQTLAVTNKMYGEFRRLAGSLNRSLRAQRAMSAMPAPKPQYPDWGGMVGTGRIDETLNTE